VVGEFDEASFLGLAQANAGALVVEFSSNRRTRVKFDLTLSYNFADFSTKFVKRAGANLCANLNTDEITHEKNACTTIFTLSFRVRTG